MPLYFLHLRDGLTFISDPDGSCLHDAAAARTEAILSARELMSQSILTDGRLGIDRRFEVADDQGNTIAIVPFREAVG
jgi:hypothetical protein